MKKNEWMNEWMNERNDCCEEDEDMLREVRYREYLYSLELIPCDSSGLGSRGLATILIRLGVDRFRVSFRTCQYVWHKPFPLSNLGDSRINCPKINSRRYPSSTIAVCFMLFSPFEFIFRFTQLNLTVPIDSVRCNKIEDPPKLKKDQSQVRASCPFETHHVASSARMRTPHNRIGQGYKRSS